MLSRFSLRSYILDLIVFKNTLRIFVYWSLVIFFRFFSFPEIFFIFFSLLTIDLGKSKMNYCCVLLSNEIYSISYLLYLYFLFSFLILLLLTYSKNTYCILSNTYHIKIINNFYFTVKPNEF